MGLATSLLQILYGFLITITVEVAIAFLWKLRSKNEILVVILASLLTYPVLTALVTILNIGMGLYFQEYGSPIVWGLELLIVYVEYRVLLYVFEDKYTKRYLCGVAFTMNLASYLVGLLIFGGL